MVQNAGMNRLLALVFGLFVLDARPLCAGETYVGEWETTYGRMILKVGNKVSGTYEFAGGVANDIHGTQEGQKLTFTYTESGVTGEGASCWRRMG